MQKYKFMYGEDNSGVIIVNANSYKEALNKAQDLDGDIEIFYTDTSIGELIDIIK